MYEEWERFGAEKGSLPAVYFRAYNTVCDTVQNSTI